MEACSQAIDEGLSMGVQAAIPGRTAWVSDIDPGACRILAHHWPDVPNLGDITKVDWSQVEPVDVLTGGFPCQDVSHAGRRAGLIRDGQGRTRSGLWGHMLRAITELQPRLVVAENVRGLLSAKADSDVEPCPFCMGDAGASPLRALGAVLADLADIGYDAAWYGLRAADVGACHGRFRVFIYAWPADAEGDTWRLIHGNDGATSDPQSGRRDDGHTNDPRQASREVHTPSDDRDAEPRPLGTQAPLTLLPTPAVNDMGAGKTVEDWDTWTAKMQASHGNGNGHGKSLAIETLRLLPTPNTHNHKESGNCRDFGADMTHALTCGCDGSRSQETVQTARVNLLPKPRTENNENRQSDGYGGKDGNFYGLVNGLTDFGVYAEAIIRHSRAFGLTAPPPTEPGPKGGQRLAAIFVEYMMGLPPGHITNPAIWEGMTTSGARNAQLKACGNGVVPAQATAATRRFAQDFDALLKVGEPQ